MRKIKFEVVFQQIVGFCGESHITCLESFDTYPEAETYCLNYTGSSHDVWIQKVFVVDKENKDAR